MSQRVNNNFKNHWVVTRPKRKLVIVPELLKVFATVCLGRNWYGNITLQREFEQKLVDFEWKALNLSKDGSGSRTYAALLSMFGLWYEDEMGVQLTQAGKEIVSGEPAVPILTKQIINYQYPSPYSVGIKLDPALRIQPHRFVIDLLFDSRVAKLSKEELAYCVLPFAKNHADLANCIDRIIQYRENPENLINDALDSSGATADNLENISNTIINQLEYTGFFEYRDVNNAPLIFSLGGESRARQFISDWGRSLAPYSGDAGEFQRRYGSGINVTKDYSKTNPISPITSPEDRLVLIAFYEISRVQPVFGITSDLVKRISEKTSINPKKVEHVLSTVANQPLLDSFEEKYLQLSRGGTESATQFEKVTTNIFGEYGFGFSAEWVGSKGAYPDIFVYIDRHTKKHGIIDTKAYREYLLDTF